MERDQFSISGNSHFYFVGISLAVFKIFTNVVNVSEAFSLHFRVDFSTILMFLMLLAVPFSVWNPAIWFSIFSTALAVMFYANNYPNVSLFTLIVMFLTLYGHEYVQWRICQQRRVYEEERAPIFTVRSDGKLKSVEYI
ncbi:unnamed protein product [Caenorhabditis auriculariae]|uniref:Uncharacterized protein n=1 Tax=Caenorhabditis auriculariae TaxID=2777116 RepID=A0A8S1HG07_9PELO|nr:unnamed protein product [Caenorhabditis auriculariae]